MLAHNVNSKYFRTEPIYESLVRKDPILVWSLDTIDKRDSNDSNASALTIVMLLQICVNFLY